MREIYGVDKAINEYGKRGNLRYTETMAIPNRSTQVFSTHRGHNNNAKVIKQESYGFHELAYYRLRANCGDEPDTLSGFSRGQKALLVVEIPNRFDHSKVVANRDIIGNRIARSSGVSPVWSTLF